MNAIALATKRDASIMKYPCNAHNNAFTNIIEIEYKEISFALFVVYVLYNWGNIYTQFVIGANVATISGKKYSLLHIYGDIYDG